VLLSLSAGEGIQGSDFDLVALEHARL
jgi:hypothetical protein